MQQRHVLGDGTLIVLADLGQYTSFIHQDWDEDFRLQKHCGDLESRNAKLSELVKKDARPAPAVAAKRKPTLKAAPGRMRRLKGKNHPPAR